MNSRLNCETRSISRRHFAKFAGMGAAMAAARPAIAQQTSETIKWRLTSSFPKNLDTLFGAANTICRVVGELTDGKFSIQPFAAGEIVPGLHVLDAVSNATVGPDLHRLLHRQGASDDLRRLAPLRPDTASALGLAAVRRRSQADGRGL